MTGWLDPPPLFRGGWSGVCASPGKWRRRRGLKNIGDAAGAATVKVVAPQAPPKKNDPSWCRRRRTPPHPLQFHKAYRHP